MFAKSLLMVVLCGALFISNGAYVKYQYITRIHVVKVGAGNSVNIYASNAGPTDFGAPIGSFEIDGTTIKDYWMSLLLAYYQRGNRIKSDASSGSATDFADTWNDCFLWINVGAGNVITGIALSKQNPDLL